jgi:hypothetical protein
MNAIENKVKWLEDAHLERPVGNPADRRRQRQLMLAISINYRNQKEPSHE